MIVTRPVLVESLYWTAFHATRVGTITACRVMLGKLPLTMSRVSYGTPLSVILTYNSVTTSSILTKVSESKRSSMDNMLAKFRSLENVAMETVTNSLFFFNDQYLSKGSRYCLEILAMCALGPKVHFMYTTQFHESYRFSVIIKQSSSHGPVDVKFHMGHWFHLFWFITPKWEIGFSLSFQQVSAQAWRRCLQNFVVRKLLLWKP